MEIDLISKIGQRVAQIETSIFTSHDWDIWAGSEPFSEHHDPWITRMDNPIPEYQDWPYIVIIGDKAGIYIHFCGADFKSDIWFTLPQNENQNYTGKNAYWLCRAVVRMALHGQLSQKFEPHTKPFANKIFRFDYEGSVVIEAETVEEAKQIFEGMSDSISSFVSESGEVAEFSELQWLNIAEPVRLEKEPTHISHILPKVMEEIAIRSDLKEWWDKNK